MHVFSSSEESTFQSASVLFYSVKLSKDSIFSEIILSSCVWLFWEGWPGKAKKMDFKRQIVSSCPLAHSPESIR